jgi:hypothetical protein
MYVIEITLQNTAMPVSVQRKTEEDATAIYEQILSKIPTLTGEVLHLTCDRQPEKKVAVLTTSIIAVQMYEKSGTPSSGKAPGFAASVQS